MKSRHNKTTSRRSYWRIPLARGGDAVRQPIIGSRATADVNHPLSVRNVVEVAQAAFRQLARRLGEFADNAPSDTVPPIIGAQALALNHADLLALVLWREQQIEVLVQEAEDTMEHLQAGKEEYRNAVDGKIQHLRSLDYDALLQASMVPIARDSRYQPGSLVDPFPQHAHKQLAGDRLR
jgi:hypothetical protein